MSFTIFLGHEHHISQKSVSHENSPCILVQAGGQLCNNSDWRESSFFTGILDTETNSYRQVEYRWNSTQLQYESIHMNDIILGKKPSTEQMLTFTTSFTNALLRDEKREHFAKDFSSYFVFPRIDEEDNEGHIKREYMDEKSFVDNIITNKKVLIYGACNSGKTALLKKLLLHFYEEKEFVALFCDNENIHGTNTERMLRDCFEDCYGQDASDYQRFLQIPKEKKIIFIDDIHKLRKESFDRFLADLSANFEYIVMTSRDALDLSIFDRAKIYLQTEGSLIHYHITPFFYDKRRDLIKKIVELTWGILIQSMMLREHCVIL